MARLGVAALAAATWTLMWFAAWPAALVQHPWLAVGLSLLLLIAPGAAAARLLSRRGGPLRDLVAGFAVSVAVLEGLGLLGCVLGASTAMPERVFGVLGAATVGLWASGRRAVQPRAQLDAAAVVPVIVAAAVAASVAALPDGGGDNFLYNAMITDFARGERLGFEDPVFPGRVKITRLWLSYWQLVLAVLSRRSGIDVLPLSSVYLSPYLAGLAVFAVTELARRLGLSRRLAALAASAQVASLLWLTDVQQPGWACFVRLREDKLATAFVLAPIWFAAAADCLRRPSRGRATLAAVTGCGVMLAHPTIFAIATLILALYAGLDALATRRLRPALALLAPASALGLVLVGVRIAGNVGGTSQVMHTTIAAAMQAGDTYVINRRRLEVGDDGGWFRIRPALLGWFGLTLISSCTAVALTRLRHLAAARYVVAAVSVGAAVLLPATAWLLGLLVTPFHLWRCLWLMPFGIAVATAASVLAEWLRRLRKAPLRLPGMALAAVEVAVLLLVMLSPRGSPSQFVRPVDWQTRAYWRRKLDSACAASFDELARLGRTIDQRGGGRYVAASEIRDFLPGVSVRAEPLAFATPQMMYELRVPDAERRLGLNAVALNPVAPAADRLRALDDAGARFLVDCGTAGAFGVLQQAAPDRVVEVARFGQLALFELVGTGI